MAIYPGARVRLIPPGVNDPKIIALGAILHTDAGNSPSLYGYFNGNSGGIESHFHIPKERQVEQYRDTGWEADANYHGNSFELNGKLYGYVSIETQGYATDPWNAYQLLEIKKLLLWLSKTHNFPLVKCASATSPGVGYHTMWGAPGPWTPVAKDCPGKFRIAQFNNNLVPWFNNPVDPEDDVTPEDIAAVAKAAAEAVWARMIGATPAVNIMARLDPGEAGIGAHVRDKVWDKDTTKTRDNSPVKVLDLLRYAQGDASRAAESLGDGGAVNTQLDEIHTILTEEDAQTDRIETAVNAPLDPVTIAGIASAVVAAMPPGEPITQEALETALRNVLGSLDGG